jgi:NADH:ubiquinone oxidoreductase subunit 4 (subunit M)
MGFAIVIASALTGLAIIRMYFSLFCGRAEARSHSALQLGLTRREAWTFGALVVALVAFGVVPRPLVDSRFAASDQILRARAARLQARDGSAGRLDATIKETSSQGFPPPRSRSVRQRQP